MPGYVCFYDTKLVSNGSVIHDVGQSIQFGAYPVFVLDGTPSPLKSQARILRFFRLSGIDLSSLPETEKGVSVQRNRAFTKYVEECVVS